MIKITAENNGDNKTEIAIIIDGSGSDIVDEAVGIMCQLPKQLREMSTPVFLHFLAELVETDKFGICSKQEETGSDD